MFCLTRDPNDDYSISSISRSSIIIFQLVNARFGSDLLLELDHSALGKAKLLQKGLTRDISMLMFILSVIKGQLQCGRGRDIKSDAQSAIPTHNSRLNYATLS